jgi:hypothetical protein
MWGLFLIGPPLLAQSPAQVIWTASPSTSDSLCLPFDAAIDPARGSVFVADIMCPRVIELDPQTGAVRRVIGREGDGPGEFRRPGLIAASSRRIAVYDLARGQVEVIRHGGEPVNRVSAGTMLFPKDLLLIDDSSVVVSGGRPIAGDHVAGITWARGASVTYGAPAPPPAPGGGDPRLLLDARLYVAGGAMLRAGSDTYVADAATGDVWRAGPGGGQRIAQGIGAAATLVSGFMRPVERNGAKMFSPWFRFPRVILLERRSPRSFLVFWTEQDRQLLTAYEASLGTAPPRRLASWRLSASSIVRLSGDDFIIVGLVDGEPQVQRVRLPVP